MAILIDIKFPQWLKGEELLHELSPLMTGVEIRLGANPGRPEDNSIHTWQRTLLKTTVA